jgi:hypothetical protein
VPELAGEPEILLVASMLLEVFLHPRQVNRSAAFEGAARVSRGSLVLSGVKLHVPCATSRVPLSYQPTPADVAEIRLIGEPVSGTHPGTSLTGLLESWPTGETTWTRFWAEQEPLW